MLAQRADPGLDLTAYASELATAFDLATKRQASNGRRPGWAKRDASAGTNGPHVPGPAGG